ncbi:hypothetical protein [Agromyces aerolatus]|uniref:hypothetical protein n=1 Tax=Agromyces sp. LY-1074 TaxID=3074080 RepID=UPI002859CD4B|nr:MULTISPECIES: hypothetical protein [unclassified Agromyces]MDR5701500.1 hypothetical protein [Agromyces sp. LY-1074]MDR5704433.1 hypothetical protein [Agromyces sp. LY-1358]
MTDTLRVPISVAASRGISRVAADAIDRRVILTNHGKPVAVVDNAERLDEDVRVIREAALTVVDAATHLVWERSDRLTLEQMCERLGIDPAEVRARRVGK